MQACTTIARMVAFHSPVLSTQLLHIQAQSAQTPLTEAQQAFNRLLTQLEEARQQWTLWQDTTQEVHTRYAKQVRPQWQALWEAQNALAQQLDALSGSAMSKLDRVTLTTVIVQLSEAGAEQAPAGPLRSSLAELYARYVPERGSAELVPEELPAAQLATPPSSAEDIDWEDPDAVAAYLEAQEQAAQQQAAQARSKHQQKRQHQQAQRKAQAAQQESKPSVRAVYRKLASSLHPDREQEPAARERKTALMQRVNQAYEADDLLALLELQWEVEQLDASRLAQLQDAHLQRYNLVLAEQLQQLQQAVRDSEQALIEMLGLNPRQRYAAHKIPGMLRQYAQGLQQQAEQLQRIALQLQHEPDRLTEWLRAQR